MTQKSDPTATSLGVVSFLNARPLIEGLDAGPALSLHYAVPSALPAMLRSGQVDAALIPVIDLARENDPARGAEPGRASGPWQRISDACIGCNGETLTVRVFSRVPPEQMTVLYADDDSHTSIALARLIWKHWYQRPLTLAPLSSAASLDDCESVLLIGDKVVTAPRSGFDHEIDLGGAWKAWTKLPFVFAVWAAPANRDHSRLAKLLSEARDRGIARASGIAAEMGPAHGWPVPLAEEYLTRRLVYTVTAPVREGMRQFLELAADEGIIARNREPVG